MDLSKMNKVGHSKVYDTNNIILDEQCTDTTIYIVLQGEVEVTEKARNSIFHIKTGGYFGGIPIIQDSIRLYTVKALMDQTIVYHIQASTYGSLIDKCPEIYVKIFANLLKHVREGIDELNKTDPVAATLYKLNSIYARINLLKESDLEDMVKDDLNYTVFVMRFLSDLSNKLNLKII
ncbi:cyclic nucleotide-binding domain-containing protein [Candidatus Galacturonibacter soehngenii]|uniref:Cyclic nucleotide-binding domain-containing protein n=1 Tax=Candidatus Galacturonatibacter soehngenii TaxID=2307010 RepID=A0A7V7QN06_9FIRM|nr:cyclic nucleotide-binding domain-containing protein [Candidatus Galacturonibacter soehngenii]KAB1440174.1 cyclic nucleotide-binding domain-containing protein [Candidatus Galacturonibacter soehngenii]MBA4685981.1 cyclic nucleotide-binding domain-containing protein [Candidatus Galacturonibacter soehngenii]